MVAPSWSDTDTSRACEIWREYQSSHDTSQMQGRLRALILPVDASGLVSRPLKSCSSCKKRACPRRSISSVLC